MIDVKEQDKKIGALVNLYMQYNPNNNKGLNYRFKAWDIISSYYTIHNKTYAEIELCITSMPLCQQPIWDQFNNYFKEKKESKSNYKESIGESLNPDEWI